jgi:hypothetical protein
VELALRPSTPAPREQRQPKREQHAPRQQTQRRTGFLRGQSFVGSASAHMIERSYGVLIEGAGAGISSRLDAFDAARHEQASQTESV